MKRVINLAYVCSAFFAVSSASAAVFSGSAVGSFANPDYNFPDYANISNNDAGYFSNSVASFNWGSGCYYYICGGQSRFVFDGVGSDLNEAGYLVDANTAFSLGNFTYVNTPVYRANSVDGVDFRMTVNLQGVGSQVFSMGMDIVNTPNTGGDVPDYVAVNSAVAPVTFTYTDGQIYTFEFLGFSRDSGLTFESYTFANEGSFTTAGLYGRFVTNATPTVVPVPAAAWLFVSGLTTMLLGSRRRLSQARK